MANYFYRFKGTNRNIMPKNSQQGYMNLEIDITVEKVSSNDIKQKQVTERGEQIKDMEFSCVTYYRKMQILMQLCNTNAIINITKKTLVDFKR